MTTYADFDRSNFPLIVVRFTGEEETEENFEAYLNGLYANYETKQSFSLVFDATNAADPKVKYQIKQAQWMKKHEDLIKKYCLGVAYVMPNTFLRIILKVIFSVQQNPVSFKVFEQLEQGLTWAKGLTETDNKSLGIQDIVQRFF